MKATSAPSFILLDFPAIFIQMKLATLTETSPEKNERSNCIYFQGKINPKQNTNTVAFSVEDVRDLAGLVERCDSEMHKCDRDGRDIYRGSSCPVGVLKGICGQEGCLRHVLSCWRLVRDRY